VVPPRDLDADVRAGVPHADDQHVAVSKLRRILVRRRVELHDRGVELPRELGDPWPLCARHRDDDVIRLDRPSVTRRDEAAVRLGEALDATAGVHAEFEMLRVTLEVVRHLVFRDERAAAPRKTQSRQSVVACRREEAQRIPSRAPRVANAVMGVHYTERDASLREVVPHRQPRLAATNDERVDTAHVVSRAHINPLDRARRRPR
jgi:hypothetical protein